MPKIPKQLTTPELQPQPPQKPMSHSRLWLLTGVMVLVLIVIVVVATQASKSSPSTKPTTQAIQLQVDQPQVTHDMDHTLTVDPSPATHDMDHTLTVNP